MTSLNMLDVFDTDEDKRRKNQNSLFPRVEPSAPGPVKTETVSINPAVPTTPPVVNAAAPGPIKEVSGPPKNPLFKRPDQPGAPELAPPVSSDPPFDFEKAYQDEIAKGLTTGEFADVESAGKNVERDNSLANYQTQKSAGETSAQAGFTPGGIQSTRLFDRMQAGTDHANLGRTNAVNQMQRDYHKDYINEAGAISENLFNRTRDQDRYDDSRSDIQYDRSETKRLEGEGDVMSFINKIEDPVARNAAVSQWVSSGQDVEAFNAWYPNMFEQEGDDKWSLKGEFRSDTPGQLTRQAAEDYVQNTLKMDPNDPNFNKTVSERIELLDKAEQGPLKQIDDNITKTEDLKTIRDVITNGGRPSEADVIKVAPFLNDAKIPIGTEVQTFLKNNTTENWVNIEGKAYEIILTGSEKLLGMNSMVFLRDYDGNDYTFVNGDSKKGTKDQWYKGHITTDRLWRSKKERWPFADKITYWVDDDEVELEGKPWEEDQKSQVGFGSFMNPTGQLIA